jgi:hypothetical protein
LAASLGIRPLFIFMSVLLFIVYFWVRRIIQEPAH